MVLGAGLISTDFLCGAQLCPPEITSTPEAPTQAAARLKAMGPMSRDEVIMTATMLGAVAMWVGGDALGIAPVVAAMLGLCNLLLTGVLTWKDCLNFPQVCLGVARSPFP